MLILETGPLPTIQASAVTFLVAGEGWALMAARHLSLSTFMCLRECSSLPPGCYMFSFLVLETLILGILNWFVDNISN